MRAKTAVRTASGAVCLGRVLRIERFPTVSTTLCIGDVRHTVARARGPLTCGTATYGRHALLSWTVQARKMETTTMPPATGLALVHSWLVGSSSYVDGAFTRGGKKSELVVLNPADGGVVRRVTTATRADIDRAVDSASHAFSRWKDTPAQERATLLTAWAKCVREHREDLERIITLENGKTLDEALAEIDYAISYIEWYAAEAVRMAFGSSASEISPQMMGTTVHEPVGVVVAVTPWNFPAAMVARKVAPALAAGCTCVVKPSEETPLTCLAFAQLARLAGLPNGVFNVVVSRPEDNESTMSSLLSRAPVRMVSFTGSTPVGVAIAEKAAKRTLRTALELGGNAPFVIFGDNRAEDLDRAVEDLLSTKFRCAGQTCIAPDRVYVHSRVYDAVTSRLITRVEEMCGKMGNGLKAGVRVGPLIRTEAVQRMERLVQDAVSRGATVVVGGYAGFHRDKQSSDGSNVREPPTPKFFLPPQTPPVSEVSKGSGDEEHSGDTGGTRATRSDSEGDIPGTPRSVQSITRPPRAAATIATPAEDSTPEKHFYAPTVLIDVTDDMAVCHEEVFGPIIALYRFQRESEVIARANITGSEHTVANRTKDPTDESAGVSAHGAGGLAAYVYTRSLSRAARVSRALDAGMVGVNTVKLSDARTPFGGTGMAGHAREGGLGLADYTYTKYVLRAVGGGSGDEEDDREDLELGDTSLHTLTLDIQPTPGTSTNGFADGEERALGAGLHDAGAP